MDALTQAVEQLTASPWLYALVLAAVAVDAFLPLVPAETVVITAGVFATNGTPVLWIVVAAAAAGAFAGDHLSYRIGRGTGRLAGRLRWGQVGGPALRWAEERLRRRGGILLVAARFVPGGRTATTLAAGLLGYPRWRFCAFVAVAAVSWAWFTALVGFLGGHVFSGQPLLGVLTGAAVGAGLTVLAEAIRRLRGRRAPASKRDPDPARVR